MRVTRTGPKPSYPSNGKPNLPLQKQAFLKMTKQIISTPSLICSSFIKKRIKEKNRGK